MHVYENEVVILDVYWNIDLLLVERMANIVELCCAIIYNKELTFKSCIYRLYLTTNEVLNSGSVCML